MMSVENSEPGLAREPDLSLAIVTLNSRELLRACLSSLVDGARGITLEVIVTLNGSTEGMREMLASDFPHVRVIENRENLGFSAGSNQGLTLSRGRYAMLLNDDTIVKPDALTSLVRYMDVHPEVGACGPRLVYADGTLQRSCFSFVTPLRHASDMLGLGKLFPGSALENLNARFGHDRTQQVDWLIGAALLVRRSVLDEVGPLDETFTIHENDSDWCYRIHKAGYPIHFVAESEIVHYGGSTIDRERPNGIDRELVRNYFAYCRKHHGVAGVAWLRVWMVLGYGARRILKRGESPRRSGYGSERERIRILFHAGLRGGG